MIKNLKNDQINEHLILKQNLDISEIPPQNPSTLCEEGWYLLPMHVSPEQKKCYKIFEQQEVEKAHDLCSSHGASLPLPENDQELDNLMSAMTKIDVLGIGFTKPF